MSYHLMLSEDVPLCGGKEGLLTFREDVADCPACWRAALNAAVQERHQEVERLREELRTAARFDVENHVKIKRLEKDLAEARAWVERITKEQRTLTCVYCGYAYPPGSPSHGTSVLTAHIKICEKHPMKAALDELANCQRLLAEEKQAHADDLDALDRVKKQRSQAYAEIRKQVFGSKVVFDREIVNRAESEDPGNRWEDK